MAREDLINFRDRPREEVQAIARKGGINAAAAKRERRTVREVAQSILGMKAPITQKERIALSKRWGVTPEDLDVMFVSLAAIAKSALKGDIKAFELIRDSAGEKPQESLALQGMAGDAIIRIGVTNDTN